MLEVPIPEEGYRQALVGPAGNHFHFHTHPRLSDGIQVQQ